jgi:hypothetical protein
MSLRRIGAAAALPVVVLALLSFIAAPGWASGGVKLCVPTKPNQPTKTPNAKGECTGGSTVMELGAEGKEGKTGPTGPAGPEGKNAFTPEQEELLKSVLPYLKFNSHGVGGKPTIQVSGANLQIVDGEGKTETVNGAGNLVLGYDDETQCFLQPDFQTGSHNLILGQSQGFSSYGSIVGGVCNKDAGPESLVVGRQNTVEGAESSITGGGGNQATGVQAVIGGGGSNLATGLRAVVAGGSGNEAGENSTVSGGLQNIANGPGGSVFGGSANTAGHQASVFGGELNVAKAPGSAVVGGQANTASNVFATVSGGFENTTSGKYSSIFGGIEQTVTKNFETLPVIP